MAIIDWADLEVSQRLNDGDVISVKFEDIDPNTSEFFLELLPHKTWWKGLQLRDNTNGEMGFLRVENSKKTDGPITVPSSDIDVGNTVVLWKAKMFGVHTPMYELAGLERIKG